MSLRVYASLCAFPSIYIFIHVYVPLCVSPSVCMILLCSSPPYSCITPPCVYLPHIYVHSTCISPSCVCPFRVYVPSVCMSPPYVCPLHVYVPSAYMSPPRGVSFVGMFLCLVVMHMPLRVYVIPCACSFCVYIPFVCLSLRMYVSSYDCCWNLNSSNNRLVGQAGGAGQWDIQVNFCAHVSLVVGVRLVGYRGSRLCPRQFGHWGAVSRIYRLVFFVPKSVGLLGYNCSFLSCASVFSFIACPFPLLSSAACPSFLLLHVH